MYQIRPIIQDDDPHLARIITDVLISFGAVGDGYACADPEIWEMYATYTRLGYGYWVVSDVFNRAMGGGGFGALDGGEDEICEIQKMYFEPIVRGLGYGRQILEMAVNGARVSGYKYAYLETLPDMHTAQKLYSSLGFKYLDAPMGNTGHHRCPVWMGLKL